MPRGKMGREMPASTTKAQEYRDQAAKVRKFAAEITDEEHRKSLMNIAALYEK
jgi:DNA-binding IclR family transcriptional regulator